MSLALQFLFPVPVALMDGIISLLDFLARFFPEQLVVSFGVSVCCLHIFALSFSWYALHFNCLR